ncbi:MAG: outer membrane protein transport protein [Betaproteobacteria bacterium]|nr:outer membrane protein transport protein [Betaproteobacteria bacterium]MCL2887319.1 outer membrane protein transport protein [Betaproteobacteria bacterium]
MQKVIAPRLIAALGAVVFSGGVAASGFQLQNQSGAGNGNAFAGAAAAAEDASTVFFNPAGMTYLPRGHNISLSAGLMNRSIRYHDKGSTINGSPAALYPLTDGNGGDGGGFSVLPHGYWAWSVDEQISLGLGIGPTYGNVTEYDRDFIGRNAGFYFDMMQININPSLAWKVNEAVSLGAGINFAWNESHFKQGVPLVVPGVYPMGNYLDVKGDDWAVGYNLGAMFQLTPTTRLGLAYRSQLDFHLRGKEKWNTPTAGAPQMGIPPLVNQHIKADLKTPANFSIALSQGIGDRWEVLADATWTDWSVVDTIRLKSRESGEDLRQLQYNFKDTWRFGLGANYRYSDTLKLRFGVAHDKSPVKSAADRTMTLPDADRTWLSLGAKFQMSKETSVDLGYTHIFFTNARTNRQVTVGYPGPEKTVQTVRGEFKTSVDILSLQLNHNF